MSEPFPPTISCPVTRIRSPAPAVRTALLPLPEVSLSSENPRRTTKIPPGPIWNFPGDFKDFKCVCVRVCVRTCMFTYPQRPEEGIRTTTPPPQLQIQVFGRSPVWAQGPDLGSLQKPRAISAAEPSSLQPRFLWALVLSSHLGWPLGTKVAQQGLFTCTFVPI